MSRVGGKGRPTILVNGAIRIRWEMGRAQAEACVTSIVMVSDDPTGLMVEHARQIRAGIEYAGVEIVVPAADVEDGVDGDIRMVRTQRFLKNGESAQGERLGSAILPLCRIQLREVVEGLGHIRMVWAQRFLKNGERAPVGKLGSVILPFHMI